MSETHPTFDRSVCSRRRAMGYLRVSTRGQAERGMSLASQRDNIEELCQRKGLELAGVVEEAASGAVRDGEELSYEHRPILLRLLDAAAEGAYEVLVVAKLDRLSRDYPSLAVLERRLQRYGVEVVSAAEENGDGPLAEFIRGQLALVAQLERAMILDRVRSGKAKRKAMGRHVHGRVPYAYRSTAGILTPDPQRADVVRRIFASIVAGDSPGRVARELTVEGVPSPDGHAWSTKAVSRIATNVVYAGERYEVKKAHPAVVSRRTFNAATRALTERSHAWSKGRNQNT
jgi:site-specific DNA recombinase